MLISQYYYNFIADIRKHWKMKN